MGLQVRRVRGQHRQCLELSRHGCGAGITGRGSKNEEGKFGGKSSEMKLQVTSEETAKANMKMEEFYSPPLLSSGMKEAGHFSVPDLTISWSKWGKELATNCLMNAQPGGDD